MSVNQDDGVKRPQDSNLEFALELNARELLLLATFYEGHGHDEQAREIYKLIQRIRDKRYRADAHSGSYSTYTPDPNLP